MWKQKLCIVQIFFSGEIHRSLQSMGPWKAPGPYGIHAAFLQKAWEVVGGSIVSFVQGVLEVGEPSPKIAETLIELIPKLENPCRIQ